MMNSQTLDDFLLQLRSQDIRLWLENDQLHYSAPESGLPPLVLSQLRDRKPEIIDFLRQAQQSINPEHSGIEAIIRRNTNDSLPLSFAQQRLWFIEKAGMSGDAYNMPLNLHFKGTLDQQSLQKSLNQIIKRHEALRTTFSTLNNTPIQVIHPPFELSLPEIDLTHLSVEEREIELKIILKKESSTLFDIEVDFPIRAQLLKLGVSEYILQLTIHHIAADGWSLGVLVNELSDFYSSALVGEAHHLPDLPIQYADFALWQRNFLQGHVLEQQLDYWKEKLREISPLQLPTDYPRPPQGSFRGASQSVTFSAELTARVNELARQQGVTLFMVLLAGFKVLLSRYSRQKSITIGSPIANRNRQEIEGLIGFFVNSLVMHTDLSGEPSFLDVLNRVQQTALEAYSYQDLPFEKLVEELQPERSLSYNPLFQVMFAVQQREVIEASFDLPNLHGNWYKDTRVETTRVDLELHLWQQDNEIQGFCTYSKDLFERETILRMLTHYQVLLSAALDSPHLPVTQLPIMTEAEKHKILAHWSSNKDKFVHEQCIHQLFELQVEKTPDAIALIFEDQALTYHHLNCQANQLAYHLQSVGVGPEALVGICIERSLDAFVALLAVLKAGGAYVPLDPSYPCERLLYMLNDSKAQILLTNKGPLETKNLSSTEITQVICLDHDWLSIRDSYSVENPVSTVQPNNLAYVIYTSGSTGVPKGVQGLHRGTINRLQWMWRTYPFEKDEIGCQKTALSFVDSVWEFFGNLLQGVTTLIIPNTVVKDPYQLVQILNTHKVTRIVVVPSLLRAILQTNLDLKQMLSPLRYWVSSGEALEQELCHKFYKVLPDSLLINLYGSTEVSADATYYETHSFDVSLSFDQASVSGIEQVQEQSETIASGVPQSPVQEVILSVWKTVLEHNSIDIKDNFFELGGDKVLGIKVVTYLNYIFGLRLPGNLLQSATSIETLAREISHYEDEPGKISNVAYLLKKIHKDAQVL